MISFINTNRRRIARMAAFGCVAVLLATSVARADHFADVPRQTVPGLPHVNGILDYSPYQLVGHFGSEDAFPPNFWTDLSGYVYDGPDNPAFNGKTFAYVGTRTSSEVGVVVFDITDASNPTVVGNYHPPGSGRFLDIDIHDGIGYVSSTSTGFWIMDLRADPIDPVTMSQTPIGSIHTLDVDVTEDGVFLYAAQSGAGAQVYDVTDPANPSFLTTINVSAHDGHAENGRYYVHGSGRTSIFDVRDIKNGNATLLGVFGDGPGENDSGSHSGRPSSDGSAYYIGHEGGLLNLHVLDIRDPAHPTLVKSISNDDIQAPFTPGSGADMLSQTAHQQFVMGNLLFNSWGPAGMTVHDITNPFDPVLVGTFDTEANSNIGGCCSEGAFAIYPLLGLDRVLISDRRNGFWIVDLTKGLLSRLSVEPSAFYAVIDNNSDGVFDDLGDVAADVSANNRSHVGEVDSLATNQMNRLVAKFALPDAPVDAPFLERATLLFFLQDIVGTPAGPLSVRHSITDNDLDLLASDYENPSYVDTLLDLVQPTDPGGRYYQLNVTLLVLADYAADGLDPLSAFRLEVTEAVFFEDNQSNRYRVRTAGLVSTPPQLILTFTAVPKPLHLSTANGTTVAQ